MIKILPLLFVVLSACAHASVGVIVVGSPEVMRATHEAIALGVPVEITNESKGPTIYVVEVDDITYRPIRTLGVALHKSGCTRVVLVERFVPASVTAHELGHSLSLRHVEDDTKNLMHFHVPHKNGFFTPQQIQRMQRHANHLRRACP